MLPRSVLDLAPYLRNRPPDGYPDGWSASLLRLQDIDGRVLGLPYHDGPECLIYRKDLFEDPERQLRIESAFGAPLAPPQTWDEFHRMARFFQRPEEGLYGTVFAAFPGWPQYGLRFSAAVVDAGRGIDRRFRSHSI